MSRSVDEIAQQARADVDRMAREAEADVNRMAVDAKKTVDKIAADAHAMVERMLQNITARQAADALETTNFKTAFNVNTVADIGTANNVLQVADAREQRAVVEKQLPDGPLKTVVSDALKQREQSAVLCLEWREQTKPLAAKGGFFSGEDATKDFASFDDPDKLAALVDEGNQIIARMPAQAQAWMFGLGKDLRNQLLHQMINDGNAGALQRIRLGFQAEPPVSWPPASAGKDCLELLRFVARDRKEDVRQTVDRALQARMAALCRRIDADRKMLAEMRKAAESSDAPARKQTAEISRNIEAFLKAMYAEAAETYGLSDYSLLAVGSLARGEVFPYSDLDYSVVACEVAEEKLADIEAYMNWQLTLLKEPALDNIGKGDPTEVADRHMAKDMDVLLDARVIDKVGEHGEEAAEEYFAAIAKHVSNANARQVAMINVMATEKEKFSPAGEYLSKPAKDVKKGLLRLPTFTVRNLIAFHGLRAAPKDIEGRCKALLDAHLAGAKFVRDVMQVVEFAMRLRLKLHGRYKKEVDFFYLPPGGPPVDGVDLYVLTNAEVDEFNAAVAINTDIYMRLGRLTSASFLHWDDLSQGTKSAEVDKRGDIYYTITNVAALPGKEILVKEMRDKSVQPVEVFARWLTIDEVEYTVNQPAGEIRATRGKTMLVAQNNTNPFL